MSQPNPNALQKTVLGSVNKFVKSGTYPNHLAIATDTKLPELTVHHLLLELKLMKLVALKDGHPKDTKQDTYQLGTNFGASYLPTKADSKAALQQPILKPNNQQSTIMKIETNGTATAEEGGVQLQYVPLKDLHVEKEFNTREEMGSIKELTDSIRSSGIYEPLRVRRDAEGKMYLVDGHRRREALKDIPAYAEAKMLVPVLIDEYDAQEKQLALIIHNGGKDLTLVEKGHVYKRLMDKPFKMDVKEISKRVGQSGQAIRDALIMSEQPEKLLKLIAEGRISATAALNILRKEGKTAEDVYAFVKELEGTGKKATKSAVKKAMGKKEVTDEEEADDEDTILERVSQVRDHMAIGEKHLAYSQPQLRKIMQWCLDGKGDFDKLVDDPLIAAVPRAKSKRKETAEAE